MSATLRIPLLLAITLFATACSQSPANQNSTTPPTETDAALSVELLPAVEQHGGSLALRLRTADGAPVTDATLRLEGDMNHAGMIPVISDPVQHEAEGIYRVPFEFTMLGDWILSVFVTTADGQEHKMQIELGVREDGITVQ